MPAAVDISSSPYDNFNRPVSTGMGNPVDMSNVGAVNTARGQNYEARGTAAYGTGVGRGDSIWNLGQDISKSALDTSKTFNDWATRDRATYDTQTAPAMQKQMDFASQYGNEANRNQRRGQAMAQAGITFDAAGDMAHRALQSYGVDPSAGRYAGLDAGLAASRAKLQALAGTNADNQTEAMGQEYLDRAIKNQMVLPGQAANEAGVGLAANNQAINTNVAAGDAANRLLQPTGWVDASQKALDQYQQGLVQQTSLGLQQNRDKAQQDLEREKLAQSQSSGLGAALGAGAGILGMLGNVAMPGVGGVGGSLLGQIAAKAMANKGGLITKYRAGGMVRQPEADDEPDEYLHREPYDANKGDPVIFDKGPYEDYEEEAETPQSDTYEEPLPPAPEYGGGEPGPVQRQRYAEGGAVGDGEIDYMGSVRHPRYAELQSRVPSQRFDPQGSGFDRATQQIEGMEFDQELDPDGLMHNPSRVPRTGMLLKGRNHPTFDHGVDVDRRMGYGLEMQNGRYYTQPFGKYAEGGDVPDEAEFVDSPEEEMGEPTSGVGGQPMQGNMVPPEASPSGGEETDDVHALLNEGEFVMPKEVTRWYGEKFLQNLIKKAHDEMAGPKAEPEMAPPTQAMAIAPPSFQSAGA